VVGSEILKKDNPKKKGHDEPFTMARIKKAMGSIRPWPLSSLKSWQNLLRQRAEWAKAKGPTSPKA
jgi:hypothetical protein